MKKVLLASTALVATAGYAAADGHAGVSITGSAEMGVYAPVIANTASTALSPDSGDVNFFQDLDVNFSMSGTTDNGLTFGASVDLDENDAFRPEDDGGASIFISGDFGTLTMGDTDGAFDWALTETASLDTIDDAHTIHDGYSGNSGLDGSGDGQVLRYDNTIGDFGVAISLEQDQSTDAAGGPGFAGGTDDVFGIGVKGSFGDIGVGLGYQDMGADDITGISISAGLGDVNAVLNYSTGTIGGADTDHTAIGLTYTSGPLGLHVNYGQFDVAGVDTDGFGLAANYDLGGGAEVQFGYASDVTVAGVTDSQWSLGIAMSF